MGFSALHICGLDLHVAIRRKRIGHEMKHSAIFFRDTANDGGAILHGKLSADVLI